MLLSASKLFRKKFNNDYLKDTYANKIAHKVSPGLDRVNRTVFERKLEDYLTIISRKTQNGTYKFTPYMEKLLSKGRGKLPRVISIPTIRDKITLSVLNQILTEVYSDKIEKRLTQSIVEDIKQSVKSTEYNYFIKIDIKNFFDSINQTILLEKINKRIKKNEIIELIQKAIQTPTIPEGKQNKIFPTPTTGVPQGISISNILANIYLADLDQKFNKYKGIKYFRYVDDILIICNISKKNKIVKTIKNELCDKLKLSLNDKWKEGELTSGFEYLGYCYTKFKGDYYGFTVKNGSLMKLENSILRTFKEYRKEMNSQQFIWNLNNRITGFVIEGNKFGWLFFYSQIDNVAVLYHLDWFVQKMCAVYKVDFELRRHVKKFVKAYFEIIKKRGKSGYIPNSARFSLNEQKRTLQFIFNYKKSDLDKMSDDDIKLHFKRKLYISVKDLEKDVQSFS